MMVLLTENPSIGCSFHSTLVGCLYFVIIIILTLKIIRKGCIFDTSVKKNLSMINVTISILYFVFISISVPLVIYLSAMLCLKIQSFLFCY